MTFPATLQTLFGRKRDVKMSTENSSENKRQGNGIDFSRLKVKRQTAQSAPTKQLRIPVGKPGKLIWLRFHPGEEMQDPDGFHLLTIEQDRDKETYLLTHDLIADPEIRDITEGSVRPVDLRIGITRQGSLFVLPISRDTKGPGGSWAESLKDAVREGEDAWIRIVVDQSDSGGFSAKLNRHEGVPDPVWPDMTFQEIIAVAFGNGRRIIDDPHHEVFDRLGGAL